MIESESRYVGTFLVVVALLFGAVPLRAQTDADARHIRALRDESNAAIARHDVPGIMAVIDDEFQLTSGAGGFIQDREGMADAFSGQFERFSDVKYVRTIESVHVGSGALRASERGTWVGTWTTAEGPLRTGGEYSAYWWNGANGWRIRSEVFVTLFCDGSGCPR